jgi:NTE family protein
MEQATPIVGLVLSGGGAKGAYQVGALRYLAEVGFEPQMIAGTSIGALNGAVLSSHPPFNLAVGRLSELWDRLSEERIVRANSSAVFKSVTRLAGAFSPKLNAVRRWLVEFMTGQGLLEGSDALFDPEPIERLIRGAVDRNGLETGVELWVAVFPALEISGFDYAWLLDFVRAASGTQAQWLRAQDFANNPDVLYSLLLASAAIPLAFPKREVNGCLYVDGGLADNAPLGALVERGCTHAIVIHLSNGAIWDRHDFPIQVIEIRPQDQILKTETPVVGTISTLLDFSFERIQELKRRGYEDAAKIIRPIIQTLVTASQQRRSHDLLVESTKRLIAYDPTDSDGL